MMDAQVEWTTACLKEAGYLLYHLEGKLLSAHLIHVHEGKAAMWVSERVHSDLEMPK